MLLGTPTLPLLHCCAYSVDQLVQHCISQRFPWGVCQVSLVNTIVQDSVDALVEAIPKGRTIDVRANKRSAGRVSIRPPTSQRCTQLIVP